MVLGPKKPETTAAHTSAPWRMDAGRDQIMVFGPHTSQSSHIATIPIDGPEDNANARLITAAPKLLKALKDILSWTEDDSDLHSNDTADRLSIWDGVNKLRLQTIRAAIAEATESQP